MESISSLLNIESCLSEMKALISLYETTDSVLVKRAVKQRLKALSQIPKINPHGIQFNERTVSEYLSIKSNNN